MKFTEEKLEKAFVELLGNENERIVVLIFAGARTCKDKYHN